MSRAPEIRIAALAAVVLLAPAARSSSADVARAQELLARTPHTIAHACGSARAGELRCFAQVVADVNGVALASGPLGGLGPTDLVDAYNLPPNGGAGVTVALVDAYDDPNAESDLAAYRAQFGLPACTTANGCFRKVNQSGKTTGLPAANDGWATEISLDIEVVSAACPTCKILLVEANSSSQSDLDAAVDTAASLGAAAISNSYGGSEGSSQTVGGYNHPGILITASTGDGGFGVSYPASLPNVLAVGGTSLNASLLDPRGWTETAWAGAGSGCSAYEPKPAFQKDTACGNRSVADVSAVADPNTGFAIYDTYGTSHGWEIVGGTSLSAPLVAAIFVRAGAQSVQPGFAYQNPSAFYDVTSGSNGSCGGTYLCTAGKGYDGPTGIGTPNGAVIAALAQGGSTGGGGVGSCPSGQILVGGVCVSDPGSIGGGGGCNSSGAGGFGLCGVALLVAAFALRRSRKLAADI